jgi:3-oxoacyl-(acyl-carrier-protein) synthase
MDQAYRELSGNPVVITGIGISASEDLRDFLVGKAADIRQGNLAHDCCPLQFLRQRKTLKFMSKQDRLALEAAGLAVEMSKVPSRVLRDHAGVFLTVGYIPFELDTAAELCAGSMEGNRFSMKKFSGEAIENINPLLAFACLPNMPAHHVAMNLEILGGYFITYPDSTQMYGALLESLLQLQEGQIDLALVGGVADQSNFLVRHHFKKTCNRSVPEELADCAGFLVLERSSSALKRKAEIFAKIETLETKKMESGGGVGRAEKNTVCLGPSELILQIYSFLNSDSAMLHHCFCNGFFSSSSTWRKMT